MRMMLRFTAPVETSNQAIKDGSLKKTLESLMAKLKPEAAYFGPLEGKRAAMIFFDMAESSKIVEICEELFLNLDAEVEFIPVMNAVSSAGASQIRASEQRRGLPLLGGFLIGRPPLRARGGATLRFERNGRDKGRVAQSSGAQCYFSWAPRGRGQRRGHGTARLCPPYVFCS
jgi:hypothetical protein